jgi:hypothetical protein
MSFTTWLSNRLRPTSRRRAPAARPVAKRRPRLARPTFRPCLEGMEERCVPSTIRVNHDLNPHAAADATHQHGTLDWAVAHAQDGDTILLTADVVNTGVTLTNGELVLTQQNLTITTEDGVPPVTINGNHASRVFEVAAGASVTLSNLVITNGFDYAEPGGGILVDAGASLTVSGCTVSGNESFYGGGFANFGTLTVTNASTVTDNLFDGIDNYGTLMVTNGSAVSYNGFYGINNLGGTATVTNFSAVSGNSADGINNFVGATLTVNNSATISANYLSGIRNYSGVATVSNSTLSGNTNSGIENDLGTVTVDSSTITGNFAQDGGGIDNFYGTTTVNSSTITGNSARYDGGGIFNYNGTITLHSSTVTGNTVYLGGVGADMENEGVLYLDGSSIIAALHGNAANPI